MEWSSGQAEGSVNKLKTTKRTMYGRASLDLLRRRLARPAPSAPPTRRLTGRFGLIESAQEPINDVLSSAICGGVEGRSWKRLTFREVKNHR